MASEDFKTVDEYIAAQPAAVRPALEQLRRAIVNAVPNVEERISYKMPAYLLHGKRLLYFAAWKDHYSIYGSSEHLLGTFRDELARYKISKGTIRFPLSDPVPVRLIERLAIFRAGEAGADEPKVHSRKKK